MNSVALHERAGEAADQLLVFLEQHSIDPETIGRLVFESCTLPSIGRALTEKPYGPTYYVSHPDADPGIYRRFSLTSAFQTLPDTSNAVYTARDLAESTDPFWKFLGQLILYVCQR